jgi:uncharacterized protein YdeI (YjbR/CyaY-like superfamily)
LEEHQLESGGAWLVLAKRGTTRPTSLTHDEALEEALCHGWIDARAHQRDDSTYLQRFCPRRARSRWSKRNVGIAERLILDARMQPRGLAEIDQARADGRWAAAYEGSANAEVPPDLAAALVAEPKAQAMFQILTSQNRYALLFRISGVKTAETRARRIEQYVAMLARGETIYPQRRSLTD